MGEVDIQELLSANRRGHPLPWKSGSHPNPTTEVLYINDAKGAEVATFYGIFSESAAAIELILAVVNALQKPEPVVVAPVADDVSL